MVLRWGTPLVKSKKRLNHEQKRAVAKDIASGMNAKHIAAKWRVGLHIVYKVMREYCIKSFAEKYPDEQQSNNQRRYKTPPRLEQIPF